MTDGIPLTPQARSMAQATATSLVVGMLIAHLEERSPGTAAEIEERLDTVVAHLASKTSLDEAVVAEVVRHARGLLATRNI